MFTPRDRQQPQTNFSGFYRGVVRETLDPKQAGRVQIQVYPMFSDLVDLTTLPWAIPADPSFGGMANKGGINVPDIGSHVFVFFENGDHRYPVYFAGAPAIDGGVPDVPTLSRADDGIVAANNAKTSKGVAIASGGTWDEPDSTYAPVYPNNRVYRSTQGVTIEIDDTAGATRLHIFHPTGTRTEVDNAGNKIEHVEAKRTTVIIGDDLEHIQGNKETTVDGTDGEYVVGAQEIKIDGNQKLTIGDGWDVGVTGVCNITVSGATTVIAPTVQVTGNVTTTGTVTLNDGTGGIVTTEHACAFTGAPHPFGSITCKAKV